MKFKTWFPIGFFFLTPLAFALTEGEVIEINRYLNSEKLGCERFKIPELGSKVSAVYTTGKYLFSFDYTLWPQMRVTLADGSFGVGIDYNIDSWNLNISCVFGDPDSSKIMDFLRNIELTLLCKNRRIEEIDKIFKKAKDQSLATRRADVYVDSFLFKNDSIDYLKSRNAKDVSQDPSPVRELAIDNDSDTLQKAPAKLVEMDSAKSQDRSLIPVEKSDNPSPISITKAPDSPVSSTASTASIGNESDEAQESYGGHFASELEI